MASVINTNSLSLMTQNNLNASQSQLNTAIQRLSSGLRINSAKDDAAGLAIANRFTANINGLSQAKQNANDGISLAQTTEGALTEVTNNLQRIRTLSVQAGTGSNSASDLQSIQDEITQRMSEIDRISQQTDFNGVKVLSSSAKPLNIQVGASDGQTISVNLQEISSKTLGLTGFNVDGTGSANKAATSTDLLVAGWTAGATTNGTTSYTKTLTAATDGAKASDVLGKIQDTGTVVIGAANYTYNATSKSYTTVEAGRTGAALTNSLTPPSGQTTIATVTLGGKSTNVKIDSSGTLTDAADGSALYLDASFNLTKTTNGATSAATVTNLVDVTKGMQTGDTIKIGATGAIFTSAGVTNTLNVSAEPISADAVAAKVNAAGTVSTIDIDGAGATAAYGVSAAGAVTQGVNPVFLDVSGSLTTTAAQTLSLHSNGVITDSSANTVYADSANPGKLTTNATSNATATANPLKALDAALSMVDKLRSSLGAIQNRLDSTIANLGTTITNLASSRSRIQDADYATEVSNMTRGNILQQAGTSVLAQANQTTQGVLSLLR